MNLIFLNILGKIYLLEILLVLPILHSQFILIMDLALLKNLLTHRIHLPKSQGWTEGGLGEQVVIHIISHKLSVGIAPSISQLNREIGIPYGVGARLIEKVKHGTVVAHLTDVEIFYGLVELGQYAAACDVAARLLQGKDPSQAIDTTHSND